MPTIRDVAREANVSEGTVSNVFNGRPYVAQKTREKVLATAKRVGYQRNTLARALRLGRGSVIGLCLRDISNPTFSTIVLGVESVARERNFQVVLGNSAGEPEIERSYLMEFLSQQVAGIIMAPVLEATNLHRSISNAGTPLVFINQRPDGLQGDLVKHDYAGGTLLATHHLLEQGHERIGIVYGPPYAAPGKEQQAAFRDALAAANVTHDPDLEAFSPLGQNGAYKAALSLLNRVDPPTALIGSTLAITLACIRAMNETSCRVDFVGTGDEAWIWLFPDLTIVRQRPEELGRTAVTQLLLHLDSKSLEGGRDVVLPVELSTPASRRMSQL